MCSQFAVNPHIFVFVFFFKQKTAYEIGTGDWSSDVCSSDLTTCSFQNLLKFLRYGRLKFNDFGGRGSTLGLLMSNFKKSAVSYSRLSAIEHMKYKYSAICFANTIRVKTITMTYNALWKSYI